MLVEAKSRHRQGVLGRPGEPDEKPDIRFRRLINDAIEKDRNNPLAIFVDTNLPPQRAEFFYEPQSRAPLVPSRPMVALMEAIRKEHGGIDPYNILVFRTIRSTIPRTTRSRPAIGGLRSFLKERECVSISRQRFRTSVRRSISTETCRVTFQNEANESRPPPRKAVPMLRKNEAAEADGEPSQTKEDRVNPLFAC